MNAPGGAASGAPSPLRLGSVPYVNAWPLLEGLDARHLHLAPPRDLAAGVRSGSLDLALMPVVQLVRYPDLERLSRSCVASPGPVLSVLLLLRRAPHRIRTLALDRHSRTSQVLARLVLQRGWGVRPRCFEADPRRAWAERTADAVLVIGDLALRMRARALPHLDLALAWRALSGHPFVFATWIGRRAALPAYAGWAEHLDAARERGLARLTELAAEAARREALPEGLFEHYLGQAITYRMGPAEEAGLRRFRSLAKPILARERDASTP